jgi:hypothetical protein
MPLHVSHQFCGYVGTWTCYIVLIGSCTRSVMVPHVMDKKMKDKGSTTFFGSKIAKLLTANGAYVALISIVQGRSGRAFAAAPPRSSKDDHRGVRHDMQSRRPEAAEAMARAGTLLGSRESPCPKGSDFADNAVCPKTLL